MALARKEFQKKVQAEYERLRAVNPQATHKELWRTAEQNVRRSPQSPGHATTPTGDKVPAATSVVHRAMTAMGGRDVVRNTRSISYTIRPGAGMPPGQQEMRVDAVRLVEKRGGKSGLWSRPGEAPIE